MKINYKVLVLLSLSYMEFHHCKSRPANGFWGKLMVEAFFVWFGGCFGVGLLVFFWGLITELSQFYKNYVNVVDFSRFFSAALLYSSCFSFSLSSVVLQQLIFFFFLEGRQEFCFKNSENLGHPSCSLMLTRSKQKPERITSCSSVRQVFSFSASA